MAGLWSNKAVNAITGLFSSKMHMSKLGTGRRTLAAGMEEYRNALDEVAGTSVVHCKEMSKRGLKSIGQAAGGYLTGADREGVARVGAAAARGLGVAWAAGATGRIASGGGLYRDRHGNRNIIGVPFV